MGRDYKHELQVEKRNHPERVKERAQRNAARAQMEAAHGKAALKGLEIHHKNGSTADNRGSNLKAVKPGAHNHGRAGSQGGKLKKG